MSEHVVQLDTFRNTLPAQHNREMWVNETYIEYRRLLHLKEKGFDLRPVSGSLLGNFLGANSDLTANGSILEQFEVYERMFGHPVPYCWTMAVADLQAKSAAAANQPGTAWVSSNSDF